MKEAILLGLRARHQPEKPAQLPGTHPALDEVPVLLNQRFAKDRRFTLPIQSREPDLPDSASAPGRGTNRENSVTVKERV